MQQSIRCLPLTLRFILLALAALLTLPALFQQPNSQAPGRSLVLAETHEIPGVFTNPTFPAKCGLDGSSIYFRQLVPDLNMPATRIDSDRKGAKIFGLESTRYHGHAHIWDFAPALNGGVYLLIWYRFQDGKKRTDGYRLLSFDGEGRLTHDAAIEGVPFDPLQIAAFANGTLVVAGRKTSERGGHKGAPGIAIISETGRLLKTLTIEHDVEPPKPQAHKSSSTRKPETDEPSEVERAQEQYDLSLNLSLVQSADDGNVYVLRQAPAGPLFQISPGGVVREIKLPGHQGGNINAAMVARGRLLLHYVKDEDLGQIDLGLYAQYDLATMEKIQSYEVERTNTLWNAMHGCYNGDQLTFLKFRARPPLRAGKQQAAIASAQFRRFGNLGNPSLRRQTRE